MMLDDQDMRIAQLEDEVRRLSEFKRVAVGALEQAQIMEWAQHQLRPDSPGREECGMCRSIDAALALDQDSAEHFENLEQFKIARGQGSGGEG